MQEPARAHRLLWHGIVINTDIRICISHSKAYSYPHYQNREKKRLKRCHFLHSQYLLLGEQAPVSGQIHLTTLVAAFENPPNRPAAKCPLTYMHRLTPPLIHLRFTRVAV